MGCFINCSNRKRSPSDLRRRGNIVNVFDEIIFVLKVTCLYFFVNLENKCHFCFILKKKKEHLYRKSLALYFEMWKLWFS